MDDNGKCKLPSTPPHPAPALAECNILNIVIVDFEFQNVRILICPCLSVTNVEKCGQLRSMDTFLVLQLFQYITFI